MKKTNNKLQAESMLIDAVLPQLEELSEQIRHREQEPPIHVMTKEDVRSLVRDCLHNAPKPELSEDDRSHLGYLREIVDHLKPRRPFIYFDNRWGLFFFIFAILLIVSVVVLVIWHGGTSAALALDYYNIAIERGDEFPGDAFDKAYRLAESGQSLEVRRMIRQEMEELKNIAYCREVLSMHMEVEKIISVSQSHDHISCRFLSNGKDAIALIFLSGGDVKVSFDRIAITSSRPMSLLDKKAVKWLSFTTTITVNN